VGQLKLGDASRDDELANANTLVFESVVKHLAVGALSGESHRCSRETGTSLHGGAAVNQDDGAVARLTHCGQNGASCMNEAERGELQSFERKLGREVDHRLQVFARRERAVLQCSDGAHFGSGTRERGLKFRRLPYICGITASRHPVRFELSSQSVKLLLIPRDQCNREAFASELTSDRCSEAGASSDDGDD